jgi:hypothetical protein
MVMVWSWYGDGLVEVKAPQQTRRLARERATGVGVGYPDASSMQRTMHPSGLIGPISARIMLSLRWRIANPLITHAYAQDRI